MIGKYLVKDSSPVGEIYTIEIRKCLEDDCYFVKFPYEAEPMIMTTEEIKEEFQILGLAN